MINQIFIKFVLYNVYQTLYGGSFSLSTYIKVLIELEVPTLINHISHFPYREVFVTVHI